MERRPVKLSGQRVAIAGMGVSGLGLGTAVKELGGSPTVFDEKPNDSPQVLAAVDSLDAQGIEAVTGWHGRLDPNDFDFLVVSPGFPRQHPSIRDMLTGGKEVLSEVEFAYRISHAPILAITGTNGKSTTTVMLWSILKGAGRAAVLCGNIAGSGHPEMTLTMAALRSKPEEVLVAEVSSYQLEWVSSFRPKVAAVTNITPDHMDRYKEFSDYYETKLRLFAAMKPQDTIVVNLDEPSLNLETVEDHNPGFAKVVGFSPSGGQGTGATRRERDKLVFNGHSVSIDQLPFFGEHNITNAMMAWEMAAQLGDPGQGGLDAVTSFRGLSNRMERLGERDGILVVNNSMCTNPMAVIASSKSLKRPQHVLMGGITKNLDFRPVGEYLRHSAHKVYVYGPEPERMNEMLGGNWPIVGSLGQAFEAACKAAKPGEAVILSPGCASAEPYANFKERGDDFRRMANDWLKGST